MQDERTNMSVEDTEVWTVENTEVWSVVLYSVFSVLVMVSNFIVIIVIIKSRELSQPSLWYIAVMAAWDFAFGIYTIVFIVPSKILNEFAFEDSYGRFLAILMIFIMSQNIFNVMIALVDRYIAICWPLHYPILMSAKRFTVAFIILLFINIVRCGILLATDGEASYSKSLGFFTQDNPSYFRSVSKVLTFIQTFIIVGLLISIRVKLSRKARNVYTGQPQTSSSQFTHTLCISNFVFIVCYIPTTLALIVSNLTNKESIVMMQIGFISMLSNSLWNVFIYATTYRPFRDAFLKLFCPAYFRERARRDIQVHFRSNRDSVFTVE